MEAHKWFGWEVEEPIGIGADFLYNLIQNGPLWLGVHLADLVLFARDGRLDEPIGAVCFDWVMSQPKFLHQFGSHPFAEGGHAYLPRLASAVDFGGAAAGEALASWGINVDAEWTAAGPIETEPPVEPPKPVPIIPPPVVPPPPGDEKFFLDLTYPPVGGVETRITLRVGPQYPDTQRALIVEQRSVTTNGPWREVAGYTFDSTQGDDGKIKSGAEYAEEFLGSCRSEVGGVIEPALVWQETQTLVHIHLGSPSGV